MLAEHVAAYAAGLYDALNARGTFTWAQVSACIAAAGMGSYNDDELADSAAAYRRSHVAPAALGCLNSLIRKGVR